MKITKKTIIRATRTFIQSFIGSFIATGGLVAWTDVEIKQALIGTLMTSVFSGLSAVLMNLEKEC